MCTIAGEERAVGGKACCLLRGLQSQYERGKISCRRLEWEGGAVSSRVALLLRSAEAQPYLPRFVWIFQTFFLGGVNVRSALCTSMGLFPKGSAFASRDEAGLLDIFDFSTFSKGVSLCLAHNFWKKSKLAAGLGQGCTQVLFFF